MEKKNVILIVADAMRADRVSKLGYRRNGEKLTPNLDELSEDGVLYERAYAPGSWTRPSQPAIMTGMWASNIGYPGRDKELDEEVTTLGEEFKKQGYETRAYNMAPFLRADQGFSRGFDYYEDVFLNDKIRFDYDHLESMGWNLINGNDNWTRYMSKKIRKWIKSRDPEKPFFLFWNPVNPHNKYEAPKKFREKFERPIEEGMDKEAIEEVAGWGTSHEYTANELNLTEEEMDVVESKYDSEIAYLDYRVGELIDFLKDEGEYENTIIAFTSDHGENFGEHGLIYHGLYLNEALIRVPLIIKSANLDKEKKNLPVSLVDLTNSLLQLSGNTPSENKNSLSTLPKDSKNREVVYSEVAKRSDSGYDKVKEGNPENPLEWYLRGLKAAIDKNYKLIKDHSGGEEMFEINDTDEKRAEIPKSQKKTLRSSLESLGSYHISESTELEEDEIKDQLEKLGYT